MTSKPAIDMPAVIAHWQDDTRQLTLDWSAVLGRQCVVTLESWEQGLGWGAENDPDSGIEHFAITEEPGLNIQNLIDEPGLAPWLATIPAEILNRVRPFPQQTFLLLRCAANLPGIRDLLEHNPCMAWLLACSWQRQKTNEEECRTLSNMRQTEIMQWLGLVNTPSAVRQLRKLKGDPFSPRDIPVILTFFRQPTLLHDVRHCDQIPLSLVKIVRKFPWVSGTPLMNLYIYANTHQETQTINSLVVDSIHMASLIHVRPACRERLQACRGMAALQRVHDTMVAMYNAHHRNSNTLGYRDAEGQLMPLPLPPHPGNAEIKPITTQEAMFLEGSTMNHCIASYIDRAMLGRFYAYHLDHPEPVSIGVNVSKGKIISLDQAKGKRNAIPSEEAMAVIKAWLGECLKG